MNLYQKLLKKYWNPHEGSSIRANVRGLTYKEQNFEFPRSGYSLLPKFIDCHNTDCQMSNCQNTDCQSSNCQNTDCRKGNCQNTDCRNDQLPKYWLLKYWLPKYWLPKCCPAQMTTPVEGGKRPKETNLAFEDDECLMNH